MICSLHKFNSKNRETVQVNSYVCYPNIICTDNVRGPHQWRARTELSSPLLYTIKEHAEGTCWGKTRWNWCQMRDMCKKITGSSCITNGSKRTIKTKCNKIITVASTYNCRSLSLRHWRWSKSELRVNRYIYGVHSFCLATKLDFGSVNTSPRIISVTGL
jgi:hypothetical protein